jgi:hypothetical protein
MAEKEITRKHEFEKTLDYMCQQLGHLQIINHLPQDLNGLGTVVNCAMDVRSAFMVYLARHVQQQATPAGTIGSRTSRFD